MNINRPKTVLFRVNEHEEQALKKLVKIHKVSNPSELLRNLLRAAAQQAGLMPELSTEPDSVSDKLTLAA